MQQSNQSLVKTSVTVGKECEELLSSWIEEEAGFAPSIYSTPHAHSSIISIYQPENEPGIINLNHLKAYVDSLSEFDLNIENPVYTQEIVQKEDWAEVWKTHFKPIQIENSLWIRPSWEAQPPSKHLMDIVLDPGLSFGTGQHATTGYCLTKIASLKKEKPDTNKLLDAGCGSGILAIAAKKLGYSVVEAFDYDHEAVKCARDNAKENNVSFSIFQAELGKEIGELDSKNGYFDFIVANILSETLLQYVDQLSSWLRIGGHLSVAGILDVQFENLSMYFSQKGLVLIDSRREGEWKSGTFAKTSG